MAVVTSFPLREVPLTFRPRSEVVTEMSALLVQYDAWRNEADALRVLIWRGNYSSFEAQRYLDDARQGAMQSVVAREMGK